MEIVVDKKKVQSLIIAVVCLSRVLNNIYDANLTHFSNNLFKQKLNNDLKSR